MAVADSYQTLNERSLAMAAAKQAVQNEPKTSQMRLAIVRGLMMLDRMPEAEKALSDDMRKEPSRADLHFQMGQICAATGRMLPAIDQLRQAVEIDRNNVGYRISLARALLDSGDLGESGRVLDTVDAANPTANALRLQIRLIQGQRVDMTQMLSQVQGMERSALSTATCPTSAPARQHAPAAAAGSGPGSQERGGAGTAGRLFHGPGRAGKGNPAVGARAADGPGSALDVPRTGQHLESRQLV